jgi:hypothetical protein
MDQVLGILKIASLCGSCGIFFAFGFAAVCKWLEWSPVNITIKTFVHHVNDRDGERP